MVLSNKHDADMYYYEIRKTKKNYVFLFSVTQLVLYNVVLVAVCVSTYVNGGLSDFNQS
jgi:hypothetical protein